MKRFHSNIERAMLVMGCLAAGTAPLHAACRLTQTKHSGRPAIVMENDLVTVRILPTERGTIDDYRLKSKPQMTLSPLVESHDEILRGSGVVGVKKLLESGNRDALWPGGVDMFNGPYSHRVLQQGPKAVSVSLTAQASNWKVERVITLADADAALSVEVKLTNTGKNAADRSYWSQTFLRLADDLMTQPGLANEVALMPARVESQAVQGVSKKQSREEIYLRNPEDQENQFVPPHQPWMAAVDKDAQLVVGVCYDIENFPRDAVFYSWPGNDQCYSLEAIYPRDTFEPGQTRTYKIRLMAFTDMAAVALLRPTYALYLNAAPKPAGNDRLVFKLVGVSTKNRNPLTVSLGVGSAAQRSFSQPVTFSFDKANDKVVREIAVPLAGLGAGTYGVYLREAGGQTFKLTGQSVAIPFKENQ